MFRSDLFNFLKPEILVLQHGDKIDDKDKIKCPEGWEWTGNWQVDDNRAVDDEGNKETLYYPTIY